MIRLSDRELLSRLEACSARERRSTLAILIYLAEVEQRKLHLAMGYGSLFDLATRHLGYSNSAAGRRIQAARCIKRYPEVARLFARGEVNLSTLSLVCRVLNDKNRKHLLAAIRNKSQREVETIVATYNPATRFRDRVKPMCLVVSGPPTETHQAEIDSRSGSASCPGRENVVDTNSRSGSMRDAGRGMGAFSNQESSRVKTMSDCENPAVAKEFQAETASTQAAGCVSGSSSDQDQVRRVEQKYGIQFAAGPEFLQKFEEARALLSSRFPKGASFEDVFQVTLEFFLDRNSPARREARREARRQDRREARREAQSQAQAQSHKHAAHVANARSVANKSYPDKHAAEPLAPEKRHVPISVRDAVFVRDQGRCTYVGTTGRRCGATHNLQIDHITPWAFGGEGQLENLRLLCAKHNQMEAEAAFGSS